METTSTSETATATTPTPPAPTHVLSQEIGEGVEAVALAEEAEAETGAEAGPGPGADSNLSYIESKMEECKLEDLLPADAAAEANMGKKEKAFNIESKMEECKLEDLLPADAAAEANMGKKEKALVWGRPGHLTQEEVQIFAKFREEIKKRGGEFKNTIYSFTEEEGEAYTLTRWLRARKYNLSDTITMVEEATECRSQPRIHDYYPNPEAALGCPPQVFIAQYPQLYSGFSKLGCPVFYSKPGMLEIDGVECITTLEGILKFHWHVMQHDYKQRLLEFKRDNPSFKRFECVSILDLTNLTLSKLGSRTMDIIKKQANIDSLCFPETMNKMVIVNAPRFFSATWTIIKGFLDARTAAKIELFSSSSAAEKCLKELIDVDQIPVDYGGTAESTDDTMARMSPDKLFTQVLYIRSSDSKKYEIKADEEADVWIYTRSKIGANFQILDENKVELTPVMSCKMLDSHTDAPPTKVHLTATGKVIGPKVIKVKGSSTGSMFSSSETFLVVCTISKKN
eukprot:CAMPEP_0203683444 /NCGR_PEP_ID=MMETSP0090-20130426/47525_1 /ASSEMBLY_ACC=CAM_ASM_001088 /TAXON_ID=426623 /ORGANISM="Chaetoceros affinis, Strain CCMP159" /LENGTH=511 /DNA_ID=CAMNT_0050552591 /DNA_START=261 /DNA_END=1797 /DNA_ORIENTATION=+